MLIAETRRTSGFAADDPDSNISVALTPDKTGTKLTLTHRGVPDGQTSYDKHGLARPLSQTDRG